MRRRPFFWLSIFLSTGVISASYLHLTTPGWLLIAGISLCSAWLFFLVNKKQSTLILLFLATIALGGGLYTFHNQSFHTNSLFSLTQEGYLDFSGVLLQTPIKSTRLMYLLIKIRTASWAGQEREINGRLKVSVPLSSKARRLESFLPGDKITLSARLLPLESFANFHSETRYLLLKTQGIHRRAFTKSSQLIIRDKQGPIYNPGRFTSSVRVKARQFIEQEFLSSSRDSLRIEGAILAALLLGEREQLPPSQTKIFQEAGIFHLFAISGAHIAIISYLLFCLFKIFGLNKRLSLFLLIPCLIFFTLFIQGRASVFRAALMSLLYILGKLIWKDIDLLNTLGISAFFLVLFSPFNLFDIGFQLTFGATLSIILLFPRIYKLLPHLPWRITELIAISTAAQIGILPLLALHFHRITFLGLFLNLPAIPLMGLIMGLGYIYLVSCLISPFISSILLPLLKFMTIIFSHLPQANLVLDFLSWRCPAPNWGVILGYYLPLIGLILVQQKTIRFGLILAFFSCIILLIASPFSSTSSSLRVTFLDVGQGQSILIEFPDQQKMLIDGGGLIGSQFDIGERVVSTFLWAKGIKTIDHLVLTHAHPDHLLGLFSVAENFRIKNFWSACSPQNEVPYQRFIRLLSPRVKRGRLSAGKELVIGEVKIQVISPDQTQINQTTQADNKTSLVLRLIYGQTSFLFPADITSIIERKLVAEKKNIQADILQVPHHGSLTSSCDEFLSSVSPIIAVASAGRHNPYHLPHPAVRQRYLQRGVVFLDTPQAGAVEITAKKNSLLVRTARTKEVYRIIYAWPPLIRAPQEK